MSAARLVIADDDLAFRRTTAALLRQDGHDVLEAGDAEEAVLQLREHEVDLLLLDVRMPGLDGVRLVEALRTWGNGVPVLMISGYGTVETAVEALHVGADDFLTKPVEPDVLSARVETLLARRPRLSAATSPEIPGLLGRSASMREVVRAIAMVAPSSATVLITGETGTGKELVARGVHALSPRAGGPFVATDCGAMAEGLLESELFGHVKGAFTGAIKDRNGVFAAADGGTIFLDEVGEVSPALQQRLLRVLQEREFTPVGQTRPVRVDVRVLAATNRDLKSAVESGRFREDLFYRLNVVRIALPPLRDRLSDIPLLAEAFLSRIGDDLLRRGGAMLSPLAMRMLQSCAWPGNVRQLHAALESALVASGGARIEAQHLPADLRDARGVTDQHARYKAEIREADERALIESALTASGGSRVLAADRLGMGRTTLWRKMRKYGLLEEDEASGE